MRNINPSDKRVRVLGAKTETIAGEPVQVISFYMEGNTRSAQIRKPKGEEGWRVVPFTDGFCPASQIVKGMKKAHAIEAAAKWITDGVQP